MYEAYVESPPLPPLVLDVHTTQSAGAPLMELDVRRCRRNALLHCAHPIPLFSPLDSVKEREACVLGDLNYIEGPRHRANRPSEVLRLLPYPGPRRYPRVAAEYLLHRGLVTWADIKYVIDATGRVAPRELDEPLAALEEAWGAAGALHLTKDSVNAMLGLLGAPRKFSYRLRSDYRPQDGVAFQLNARYGDVEKTDYIFQTKMLTNQSHRPLCDVALFTEHTRVAQILYVLKQLGCPPRNVVSVKTDAVIFHCGRTLRPKVVDAAALRFDELHLLRRRYEPLACSMEAPWNMAPIDGLEPAFKLGEGRPLRCASADVLATESLRVRRPPPFQDVDPRTARELALSGHGLFVEGIAGTGKTHFMKQMVQELREAGKTVVVVAKTHSAVQNAEGSCTADHFCYRYVKHGSFCANVLVVEELSQIDISIWAELGRLQFVGKQFICLGDFNQFSPIGNQWRGTPVPVDALESSGFLRELCPFRTTLTENKRSDPPLFDWYSSLIPGGSRYTAPLSEVLDEARRDFPCTD